MTFISLYDGLILQQLKLMIYALNFQMETEDTILDFCHESSNLYKDEWIVNTVVGLMIKINTVKFPLNEVSSLCLNTDKNKTSLKRKRSALIKASRFDT